LAVLNAAPLLALALSLGTAAPAGAQSLPPEQGKVAATQVEVTAVPVPLDPKDTARSTVGTLTYTGGLQLRSEDANFGGISGLVVEENGCHFIAMSDRGTWFSGEMVYEKDKVSGLANVEEAPMRDWRGRPLDFSNNDSEGLAFGPKGIVVSFEGFHRIWRYSLKSLDEPTLLFKQTALAIEPIPGMAELPRNGGVEALAELTDGRLLAITEEGRTEAGEAVAWLISEDGAEPLSLPVSGNFKPTDATALGNGDVLLLERRFSLLTGAAMRLRLIRAASIAPGGSMQAQTLATIEPPMTVDNMEAVAAIPAEDGGYRIFVASDDNFNLLQRTLLLTFHWQPQSQ